MNYQYLTARVKDRVGWIEYNNPPINSFNWEMLHEISTALEIFLKDPGVRVIVFASALEKYFSTGAEIRVFDKISIKGIKEWISTCHGLVSQMRQARKPLLAAIRGIAASGGLEIVLHCDIRFAALGASLGHPEINIAFMPTIGATQALIRLLGRPRALRFLYEGNLVPAEEAHAMGLIDLIYPPDRLHEEVQAFAFSLVQKPALALAAVRFAITEGETIPFEEGLKIEFENALKLAGTKDFSEGIRAFLGKRKPIWN
jgi:enoyl-CoA hydratase